MTAPDLTYAKVGGPPACWRNLTVVDLDDPARVIEAIEVNATKGWAVVFSKDASGKRIIGGETRRGVAGPEPHARTERINGRFEIRYTEDTDVRA